MILIYPDIGMKLVLVKKETGAIKKMNIGTNRKQIQSCKYREQTICCQRREGGRTGKRDEREWAIQGSSYGMSKSQE